MSIDSSTLQNDPGTPQNDTDSSVAEDVIAENPGPIDPSAGCYGATEVMSERGVRRPRHGTIRRTGGHRSDAAAAVLGARRIRGAVVYLER
ncbi:hypothetical protein [Natrinema sp. 1APR25-10V2]|uniref:hypothetical protein n=1 Tax=Natrinema sp. 1APR25-10V2 TaxID=2951081 RepID=UPI0028766F5F|nr:hypothetical protein [Natrinema sp. 1APR25-10V2]MDS0477690.1 hypothetical protein [Natrinema sp. 1APR25-10V2]